MKHYDGPAFYRRFLHESTQLKKEKRMQSKTFSKNVIADRNSKNNRRPHIDWGKEIQENKTHNPIAERARAFQPRHNYNSSKAETISFDKGFENINDKYNNIMNELLNKDYDEYFLLDKHVNPYIENQDKIIQTSKPSLNEERSNNLSNTQSNHQEESTNSDDQISEEPDIDNDQLENNDNYNKNDANEESETNDNSSNNRLGHSLSSILNSENNVQKRLALFNQKEANKNNSKDNNSSDDKSALNYKKLKKNSHAKIKHPHIATNSTEDGATDENNDDNEVQKNNDLDNDKENNSENKDSDLNVDNSEKTSNLNSDNSDIQSVDNNDEENNNDDGNNDKEDIINDNEEVNNEDTSEDNQKDNIDDNESYRITSDNYKFPKFNLLTAPKHEKDQGLDDWILKQAEILDKTLNAFKVKAKVVDWTNGPTVTQFQIKLELGVKVNKITNLTDDLKLALAAKDIRIEAPIPGKTTVGIEIPNPKPRPVMLSEVLESDKFKKQDSPLSVALGVDLTGQPQVTDLRKMPHGLIAGATGSGKSVFINSLLVSLLYKATPDQLKIILIDPKAVEMEPYNNIPHLISPVISEPKEAAAALKWTVKEMNERYERLSAAEARNIEQYNQKAEDANEPKKKMPYILIVIDELADLMMTASDEVEDYIVRITQKARAAGIHLMVATQRPSVDVVTGTIKNNIPTRVAFMVSSQVDSRTIIDTSGAERLLGKGDMLYLGNGSSQSMRLQGTFVTSDEIDRVTNFARSQGTPYYAFQPKSLLKKVNQVEKQDDLMPRVLAYISKEQNVSTSKLQRVFSIGYNRAANLIDDLERNNYVSGQHGSKPRDVYLNEKEYQRLNL